MYFDVQSIETLPIEVELRILEINGEKAIYTDDLSDPDSEAFKETEVEVCKPSKHPTRR